MFRPSKAGDWAADDEDDVVDIGVTTQVPPRPAAPSQPVQRTPSPQRSAARAESAPAPVANRWERFRQQQQEEVDQPPARGYARDRDYGARDRDYGRDRDSQGGRDRDYHGGRDRDSQGGRDSRRYEPPPMPMERGVVVAIKDSFGFVSCADRDGDLFFHLSEAPVDIEMQDEVEFKVKNNHRAGKDIAVQMVRLPKGSIVWEEVAEELLDGVVTKGIPKSGHHHHGGYNHTSSRDDPHGLVEVQPVSSDRDATESSSVTRRTLVRFTAESVAVADAASEDATPKRLEFPHLGDTVQFRVATHRKTGQRRAVALRVVESAHAKLEKEMEAKLATLEREQGVVNRVKGGGAFIRCCDRTEDVYFPFHELRESEESEGTKAKTKLQVREGDEVSFYVYADSEAKRTALRVVKLPTGTVSFEELQQADAEGVVGKVPKEPRYGSEVVGMITPAAAAAAAKTPGDETHEQQAPPVAEPGKRKLLKKKKTVGGLAFRLADATDMAYAPAVGDVVQFDRVLDKRSRSVKAVNVRVVKLNPANRATGMVSTLRDDYGFIKCADRKEDAYFKLADVMIVSSHALRAGAEVAFDVVDAGASAGSSRAKDGGRQASVRAVRVELLPPGSVQWESVVATDVEGEVLTLPARKAAAHKSGHARPGKPTVGRVRVTLPQPLVTWFPELKRQIDDVFLGQDEVEETKEEKEDKAEEEKTKLQVEFPSTLSKHERAALHAYCDALGVSHASEGNGTDRRLIVTAAQKVAATASSSAIPLTADAEFSSEDVADVRYNPRAGDRVALTLALTKRSKELVAKHVVLVAAAPPKQLADKNTAEPTAEGFVVAVKTEAGFGFIQPVNGSAENVFFHVKELETPVEELAEGAEVQYRLKVDDKTKRTRAVGVRVVPAGTIKRVAVVEVRGVVQRASILQRFRKGKSQGDKSKPLSSAGRILVVAADVAVAVAVQGEESGAAGASAADDEDENEEEEEEEVVVVEDATKVDGGAVKEEEEKAATGVDDTAKTTKTLPKTVTYHVHDVADLSVVVREGDEVAFVPQVSSRNQGGGWRATQLKLVKSHARQGVVVRESAEGGVIRVDGEAEDAEPSEVAYTARQVLRGDVLSVGDRVEFAIVKRPPPAGPKKGKKVDKKSKKEEEQGAPVEAETEAAEIQAVTEAAEIQAVTEPSSPFVATSVRRLASGGPKASTSVARPESRSVNSTLLQAMRQTGAAAVVKSRMARGPDGSRGFPAGWRTRVEAS